MIENLSNKIEYTGWELNYKENLLLNYDKIYFQILSSYRLVAANTNNTLFAIIRDSDAGFYGKPNDKLNSIKLLSVYSDVTWRHFYLPNNQKYLSLDIVKNRMIIVTEEVSKMITFAELNRVPILFDYSEINRRVFFDSLNVYKGK